MKNKLTITTPNDREIVMTRSFDAPRELVWEAWTKPELLKRWLGAFHDWTFEVCEVDLRVGGAYRFVWRRDTGEVMGMGGIYREIIAPERTVATERFDDPWYEGEGLSTLELEEHDGRTTLINTVRYGTNEIRDAVLRSGMESGVTASYDALETLLAAAR